MMYDSNKPYYTCVICLNGDRRSEVHHASFAEAHHYYLEFCRMHIKSPNCYVDIGNWDETDNDNPSGLSADEKAML